MGKASRKEHSRCNGYQTVKIVPFHGQRLFRETFVIDFVDEVSGVENILLLTGELKST